MTSPVPGDQRLHDLVWLRRVRDRIDREYAEPLDVEALARGAHMSAGHLSRAFRASYGESPHSYLMTRRIEFVLHPPAADPGVTADERRTITEMMTKGTYAMIILATMDLQATFDRLQAAGAEVVQEPTDQPWGVRDCAFRDPAGNHIRINEQR